MDTDTNAPQMKWKWLILSMILLVGLISLICFMPLKVKEETKEGRKVPVLYTLSFPDGEKIEITEVDWSRTMGISTTQPPKWKMGGMSHSSGRAGGYYFDVLNTETKNGEWLRSSLSLHQPGLFIVAQALKENGDTVVSESIRYSDGRVDQVKFEPSSEVFRTIERSHGELQWSLEFDIGNGRFLPFSGALTACAKDGRAFNWYAYTPSSPLRVRGVMGGQTSDVIEIDITKLKRKELTIANDTIPAERKLDEFVFKATELSSSSYGSKNIPSIKTEIESTDPHQDKDSWGIALQFFGDELGNRSLLDDYLMLPEAEQVIIEYKLERSASYHWHLSDVEIFAEGVIPESADMSTEKSFGVLKLDTVNGRPSSFAWKGVHLSVHDHRRKKSTPEWRVRVEGEALEPEYRNFIENSQLIFFIDEAEYSVGESFGFLDGGSSASNGKAKFDYNIDWRGELKPGQKIRIGVVKSKPPAQWATFSFPRDAFPSITPPKGRE